LGATLGGTAGLPSPRDPEKQTPFSPPVTAFVRLRLFSFFLSLCAQELADAAL